MDEMQPIASLINATTRLAVIETDETQRVVDWLRAQYNITGKASYHWTAQNGLRRLATEHIPIPQTMRPTDVVAHILASHHFGIYLLCDFQAGLKNNGVSEKLKLLITDSATERKLVLLVGKHYQLPASLAGHAEHIALI